MKKTPLKRKSKTPLAKAKLKLWALCRELVFKEYGTTCYTCGKTGLEGSNLQCGHFITKSTCSGEIAYALENLRPQCFQCNINLSGNWVRFEEHLKKERGEDFVENLKKRNQETKGLKYDELWYLDKIKEYQELC